MRMILGLSAAVASRGMRDIASTRIAYVTAPECRRDRVIFVLLSVYHSPVVRDGARSLSNLALALSHSLLGWASQILKSLNETDSPATVRPMLLLTTAMELCEPYAVVLPSS